MGCGWGRSIGCGCPGGQSMGYGRGNRGDWWGTICCHANACLGGRTNLALEKGGGGGLHIPCMASLSANLFFWCGQLLRRVIEVVEQISLGATRRLAVPKEDASGKSSWENNHCRVRGPLVHWHAQHLDTQHYQAFRTGDAQKVPHNRVDSHAREYRCHALPPPPPGVYCENAVQRHDGQKAMTAVGQVRPEPDADIAT